MPEFLDVDLIIDIHNDQLLKYGGLGGILDRGKLDSAVATPQAGFGGVYLHKDLFEMAAAYLFHLVKNHPFNDGNKRVGLAAAVVFLKINGLAVEAPNQALADLTISVAEGKTPKAAVAAFFKTHCIKDPA
jgi:death-on-curing protein